MYWLSRVTENLISKVRKTRGHILPPHLLEEITSTVLYHQYPNPHHAFRLKAAEACLGSLLSPSLPRMHSAHGCGNHLKTNPTTSFCCKCPGVPVTLNTQVPMGRGFPLGAMAMSWKQIQVVATRLHGETLNCSVRGELHDMNTGSHVKESTGLSWFTEACIYPS